MSLSKEKRSSWVCGFVAFGLEDVVVVVAVAIAPVALADVAPVLVVAAVAVLGDRGGREGEASWEIDAIGLVVGEAGIYTILVVPHGESYSNDLICSPDRTGRCVARRSRHLSRSIVMPGGRMGCRSVERVIAGPSHCCLGRGVVD